MQTHLKTILLFGNLLADGVIRRDQYLLIRGGKIASIAQEIPHRSDQDQQFFLKGKTIIPGFVDLHIHGVGDFDLFAGDAGKILEMTRYLARFGVTGFLPTLCTADRAAVERGIRTIVEAAGMRGAGARILGIHMEGPFINPEKAGAQDRRHIAEPDRALLKKFIDASVGLLKIVTLAPEMPGSGPLIDMLRAEGITAGIGHSNAGYDAACSAIDRGISYATHLGNAMRPIHHRDPGAVGACLLDNRARVEIIPDGVHLHPAFVKMVVNMKGADGVIGVTDSLCGVPARKPGYPFGGGDIYALEDRYAYKDGTIAGSRLTMNTALKNLVKFTGKDIADCVKFLTINPLQAAGLAKHRGVLKAGCDADIAVIDDDFDVVMTLVAGEVVYKR